VTIREAWGSVRFFCTEHPGHYVMYW